MRHLISVILILIFLTLTIQIKAETKQNDLLNNLPLISATNPSSPSFILGNSVSQRDEILAESAIKRYDDELASRDKGSGTSFTGHGEAKKLYIDTQFKDCVSFAKAQTGISRSIGNGGRNGINTQKAQAGEIGVESGKIPHATVVVAVDGDNITIHEANYMVDKDGTHWITERVLPRSRFLGFIYG